MSKSQNYKSLVAIHREALAAAQADAADARRKLHRCGERCERLRDGLTEIIEWDKHRSRASVLASKALKKSEGGDDI